MKLFHLAVQLDFRFACLVVQVLVVFLIQIRSREGRIDILRNDLVL